jgi:hypothetical protein
VPSQYLSQPSAFLDSSNGLIARRYSRASSSLLFNNGEPLLCPSCIFRCLCELLPGTSEAEEMGVLKFLVITLFICSIVRAEAAISSPSPANRRIQAQIVPSTYSLAYATPVGELGRAPSWGAPPHQHIPRQTPAPTKPPAVVVVDGVTDTTFPPYYCGFYSGNPGRQLFPFHYKESAAF